MRYIATRFQRHDLFPKNPVARAKCDQALDYYIHKAWPTLAQCAYPRLGWDWMIQKLYVGLDLETTGLRHIQEVFAVVTEDFLSNGGPADRYDFKDFIGGSNPNIADFAIAPLFQLLDVTDIETAGEIQDYEERFYTKVPFAKIVGDGGAESQIGITDLIARKMMKQKLEATHKARTGRIQWGADQKKKPPTSIRVAEVGMRVKPRPPPSATLFLSRLSTNCHGPWMVLHQICEKKGGSLKGETMILKEMDLNLHETRSPEFVGMNRAHSVPTLLDKDGTVVYESHAIMRYLQNTRAPNTYVCGPPECVEMPQEDLKSITQIDMALDWKASTLQPAVERVAYPLLSLAKAATKETRSESEKGLMSLLGILEKTFLNGQHYIGGGHYPSIADVAICACLRLIKVDESFTLPDGIKNYDHHVRNMLPYLDTIATGDGAFGIDDLVTATIEHSVVDPLNLCKDRSHHAIKDDIMDDLA